MATSAEPSGSQSGSHAGNPFPQVFGKYVLLRPMARGGMGELFLAAAGETGGFEKLCVVKKVLTDLDDGGVRRRFLDEAKVVVRLNHANLVQVFDAGRVGEDYYLAMELIEGKDLRGVWNRCAQLHRRIPVDFAIFAARELCRALDYVHDAMSLDLVHRDISPPNIMVSYHGQIKVTDFGLATHAIKRELTNPGVVFGRYSYLSPEQARGLPADRRTDIYAAGIVLWEMLTGRQLFPADRHQAIGAAALSELRNPKIPSPASIVPGVPEGLDEVVLRALAIEREERFQTAGEFKVALSEILARHYPSCDVDRVAAFMREIFAREYKHEAQDYAIYAREDFSPIRAQATLDESETLSISDGVDVRHPTPGKGRPSQPARQVAGELGRSSSTSKPVTSSMELGDGDIFELDSKPAHGGGWQSPPPEELAAAAAARVGSVVDKRYRIDRLLGVGGMGAVFAVTHLALGKTYALKILHEIYGRDADLIDRFMREARAATQTGHPNIIDVVDIGTMDGGDVYFVMELLEGTDLGTVVVQSGPMAIRRAVHIGRQICRAVSAAHDAGIIHRDLKSENVVLTVKGGDPDFVKVLDFGICKQLDPGSATQTTPGMVMGSPAYMAPEQAAGAAADITSDIYALGTILFEMLTGRLPFTGRTAIAVLMKKGSGPAPSVSELRPEVSDALADVVARCLDADPDNRPASMKALEYELTRAIEGRASAVAALMGLQIDADPNAGMPSGAASMSGSGSGPRPAASTSDWGADGAADGSLDGRAGSMAGANEALGADASLDAAPAPKIVTVHDQAAAHTRAAEANALSQSAGPRRRIWIGVGVGLGILILAGLALAFGVFGGEDSANAESGGAEVDPETVGPEPEPEPDPGLNEDDAGATETGEEADPANDAASILARAEVALEQQHWREPLAESLAVELNNLGIVEPGNEALAKLRSEAAEILEAQAQAAAKAEDWLAAVTAYRDLFAVWPGYEPAREDFVDALRELGRQQRGASDYEGLLATAEELLNREPKLFVALKYRAEALAGLERWEEAVPAYRAAMRVRASNKDVKKGYWRARQKLKQQGGN